MNSDTHRSAASQPATPARSEPSPRALKTRVLVLAIAGALGGFLFGYDSSVINGAVNAIEGEFVLRPAITGFAVASALLGCVVGAYFAGQLSNRWGRIPVMLLGSALFFVSAIGSGLVFGVWDLIFWRVVGGLGIGIASVTAPAYIAEIAPRKIRGRLASLQQLAITVGIFAALLTNAFLADIAAGAAQELWLGLAAWRWMFMAEALPAVLYGVVALLIPESPRYLMLKGDEAKARAVLSRMVTPEEMDRELRDIREALVHEEVARTSTLRGSALGLKPIVWIGIAAGMLQQFLGINAIFYYSTTLWQSVGFTESDSFRISVLTGLINIAVTFIAIALIDRIGRRKLLLIGSVGMLLTLGTMAIAFSQSIEIAGAPSLPGAWGPVALVAANLYVVCFGATWGPVLWVLLGEIFPNKLRAKAMGVAAGMHWIANFLVSTSFPVVAGISLGLAYGIFTFFAAVSIAFVWLFLPETNGLSLEEADTLLPATRTSERFRRRV
ncbi:sugar porter family MFS transporter [Allosalinactinospora lopnorensis]|uniref:sugar porter family MFS transporter n=1 Tax=Allosalinactinospora lopnorensis TaxID=1352348 RepID=UPI0009E51863|nr:sugar porter family MFS transporter [Allosalinactinospora lopnorensis]